MLSRSSIASTRLPTEPHSRSMTEINGNIRIDQFAAAETPSGMAPLGAFLLSASYLR